jgi:glycolate oxidase FAD binding subunit
VGSQGTIGFLGDVILRTRPIAPHSAWFTASTDDPMAVFAAVHRPVSVLWDGAHVHVLLEGHHLDVAEQATRIGLVASDGPPPLPTTCHAVRPADVLQITAGLRPGTFVAELGMGVVHGDADAIPPSPVEPGVAAITRRVKDGFDLVGRLNPGRTV